MEIIFVPVSGRWGSKHQLHRLIWVLSGIGFDKVYIVENVIPMERIYTNLILQRANRFELTEVSDTQSRDMVFELFGALVHSRVGFSRRGDDF